MKNVLVMLAILLIVSCKFNQPDKMKLSKDEMLRIVKECDHQFSIGIKKRDSLYLANIYSDRAQYVTPKKPIILGKIDIEKDWGGFLRMKENPIDLILNAKDVRGNREIIYETGQGYTLLADSTKWTFNYVNVWRLMTDGSYKLEIDTYN
jgi:ketosteroid isomerase-like protein